MFGFLKDVGKELMDNKDGGGNNQGGGGPPQGGYGPPQGGYGPPQGGYGPPQGGYGPPQGGYGPPQGGYGPPQGGYGPPQGGYGPPQGGYGPPQGGYGPPPGQDQSGGGLGGLLSGFLGSGGGGQGGGNSGGGSGMNDLISGMASQMIGGGGQGGDTAAGNNDMISGIATSVISNVVSGGDGQNTMQKTGLNDILISGIVSNVIQGVSGNNAPEPPAGASGGISSGLISAVTSSVITQIMSQDKQGQILNSNDGAANSGIISGIVTKIIQKIVSGGHGQPQQGGGSGGLSGDLISGMASQYIGNMLSGGGRGHVPGQPRSQTDVLSGIASSLVSRLLSGGGGPRNPGGSIASNIIGKIMSSHETVKNDDGTIQESVGQMQVDPSRKRVFPDPGSLISSFLNKGAYHFRNKFNKGGGGGGDAIQPATAVYNYGERGSGLRPRGEVQDFYALRQECLDCGTLYVDTEFPACDESIFFSKSPPKPFEWKRPTEIEEDPQLFIDGATRFDVKQGELGDCWLLAAVANLTLSKNLFFQIVPSDQGFGDNYAGIFHFRFWQYGRWVDVVVDDLLPTFNNRLVFMHSDEKNEFWSALVEKAYAKLHGSYEALKGGTTCEAMEDFTGGVSEIYDLTKAPVNLFNIMLKAYERGSLMGCSVEPDANVVEARCSNGLVRGHAYSITRIKFVDIQTPRASGKIPLVRIRNPWGNEAEWNGAWSDQSDEWQFIPADEREEIGLTFEHDGEFWMSYKDFTTNFTLLEMTNLSPDTLNEDDLGGAVKHHWEMSVFEGAWIRGATAGGCRNNLQTFWHNPQYIITLTDVDDDDEDNKCTVIIALMQKNRRSQRKLGLDCLTIGFAIYHLPDPENAPRPLDMSFFKYNASVARSPSFINMREVSCRFKLPPGSYCIVPSTFDSNDEGEFILRVFSEKQNEMTENDEEVGTCEVDERVEPEEDESGEADERVTGFFGRVAGDDDEIDNDELKGVLDFALTRDFEFDFPGFSPNVIRSMIAMLDVDRSGKLGLHEFIKLWKNIRVWKNVFKLYDKDTSGFLNGFELREALHSAGYRLNNHILSALMLRYGDQEGNLSFDDFVMCSVKLKTLMGSNEDMSEEEKMADFYQNLFKDTMESGAECAQEEE